MSFVLPARNGLSSCDSTTISAYNRFNLTYNDDDRVKGLSYSVSEDTGNCLLVLYKQKRNVNLNFDTISRILDFCSKETLQSCRQCCSAMYQVASVKLFTSHPISRKKYMRFVNQFKQIPSDDFGIDGRKRKVDSMSYLKYLIITKGYQSFHLNSQVLGEIFKRCTGLKHVELTNVSDLEESFSLLLTHCKSVSCIKLRNCELVSDDSVASWNASSRNALNLECLELIDCKNISSEGLNQLLRKCPFLKSVKISHCRKVTGSILYNLLTLPRLSAVVLKQCGKVSDQDLIQITQCAFNISRNLEHVGLISNYGIISKDCFIDFLKQLCYFCYKLSVVSIVLPMNLRNDGVSVRPELLSPLDLNEIMQSKKRNMALTILQSSPSLSTELQ